MWRSTLILNNKINDRYVKLNFMHRCLYTYNDLYDNLSEAIGSKMRYKKHQISFKTSGWNYGLNYIRVDDWNRFLDHDNIIKIKIYDPTDNNYILYTEKGEKLMKTKDIKIIYKTIKLEKVDQPLLIYLCSANKTKIKLIDVIDPPQHHYNKLVNRLVSKYGSKGY